VLPTLVATISVTLEVPLNTCSTISENPLTIF